MQTSPSFSFANISRGDPVASLARSCPSLQNELDRAGGRYVVVCFYLTADAPWADKALDGLGELAARFGPDHAVFQAVGVKPEGEVETCLRAAHPHVVLIRDLERKAARVFGALPLEVVDRRISTPARPSWLMIDPTQHVLATFPCTAEGGEVTEIGDLLAGLPPPDRFSPIELPPPILILPNVFEPELCRILIDTYERHGGQETGISVNAEVQIDHSRKRRRDCRIDDPALIEAAHRRLRNRIAPEIKRLFFMDVTRLDRNIVACYAAEDEAHFMMAHRDNNSPTTAYRRFAVSINLTDDFEGGCVRFPEYSQRDYKAPAGWAVVFPCAILHQVTKVTAGRRYVFLPFVFD
jgi:predicted 2-oxoglutarate/Fe(II)-dependent dioxygenase YbiX